MAGRCTPPAPDRRCQSGLRVETVPSKIQFRTNNPQGAAALGVERRWIARQRAFPTGEGEGGARCVRGCGRWAKAYQCGPVHAMAFVFATRNENVRYLDGAFSATAGSLRVRRHSGIADIRGRSGISPRARRCVRAACGVGARTSRQMTTCRPQAAFCIKKPLAVPVGGRSLIKPVDAA